MVRTPATLTRSLLERITTMAHVSALVAALTFSATFNVDVDEDGVIDWDSTMPGVKAKIEEAAQASRDDRDDVLAVLDRNSGDYVQEQILVSEVLKLRERRENVTRKNRDVDADHFEFTHIISSKIKMIKILNSLRKI